MNIIVTGTLGFDYIMDFSGRFADRIMADKIHKISLSFLADKLTKNFGGTAGNIAYSLNLLGEKPIIVSPAGDDFAPYKLFLKKHRVDTRGIVIYPKEMTGTFFVVTDKEDNQIGSFYSGATKHAKELSLLKYSSSEESSSSHHSSSEESSSSHHSSSEESSTSREATVNRSFAILAPTEPEAMIKYVRECSDHHIPYLYDPAFQIDSFSAQELREGISGAEIFIGNDYEISLVEQKLEISHEELRTMVPILITTLGSKGSIIETRRESIHIKPAKSKKVVDPTGAGDAYRAGFLSGYLRFIENHPRRKATQKNRHAELARLAESKRVSASAFTPEVPKLSSEQLLSCGQIGSIAAVYVVESYGTVTHHYTKAEFQKRFSENYK